MAAATPATSPGAWQACGNHGSGRHHWRKPTADASHHVCKHCGLIAATAQPPNVVPRRKKNPTSVVAPRHPCPLHPAGRHAWQRVKGNEPVQCTRCGVWRVNEQSPQWHRFIRACFKRDGAQCFYCGEPLTIEAARLDHFVPASKGGGDGLHNRRASCRLCDKAKADQMPWEFMPERFTISGGTGTERSA